jgi:hypothetical protein
LGRRLRLRPSPRGAASVRQRDDPGDLVVPDGIAYVLCLYVPDLARDVVAPLRRAGYRDDEIAGVVALPDGGGSTR